MRRAYRVFILVLFPTSLVLGASNQALSLASPPSLSSRALADSPHARGAVLLSEDFDDGVADDFLPQSGSWEVVDGVYHGHTEGYESDGISIAGDAAWADYRVEYDLMTSDAPNQMIAFRIVSLSDHYFLNMRADPWNDVVLTKVVDGVRTDLAYSTYVNQDETWHHMIVELTGAHIRFICDGHPLLDYTDGDDPFLYGMIGAFSHSGGSISHQDVYYDNVVVIEIAAPAFLLAEDFEDGVADDFTPLSGSWQVVDGVYNGYVQGYDVSVVSAAGESWWSDYRLEADIKVSGSLNHVVAFRLQDASNYYFFNVRPAPWSDAHLHRVENGIRHDLATVSYSSQVDLWHHVMIEVGGPLIRCSFDGDQLFEYWDDDSPNLNGKIGLVAHAGGNIQYQNAYFDNVVVAPIVPALSTSLGPVPGVSGPISCGETVTLGFHYGRGDADPPPVKGYSIRVQAGQELLFTKSDIKVSTLPGGSQVHYEITEHAPNDCTIDYVILGTDPGIAEDVDLFAIDFHACGSGVAGVRVSSARLRDSENRPIEVHLTSATVTAECVPPDAVGNLAAAPGHESITVTWSDPGDPGLDLLEIWRGMWHDAQGQSTYPEYDDVEGNVIPGRPASRSEAQSDPEWELIGAVGPGVEVFVDQVSARGVYDYEVFARAASGVYGPPAEAKASATNYWLGDINGYDGMVNLSDLTVLVKCYGSSAPDTATYNNECDIGPTVSGSLHGIPCTDNVIDFEDLVVLGLNYNVVDPAKGSPASGATIHLSWRMMDEKTWSLQLVQPCPELRGLNLRIPLPADAMQSLAGGELIRKPGIPVFLRNIDSRGLDIGLMVLGGGAWGQETGELFQVRLTGAFDLTPPVISARGAGNRELACELQEQWSDTAPATLRLQQNYPNPFNPATTIRLSLPETQHVSLAVYALDGRRIATLLDSMVTAGHHDVVWHGRDDRGRVMASGTYIYRLKAGSRIETKRMMLVR
jgi:hypothetical protein